MPGLLIMNSSGADARDGESRKRTHDGRLVNGDRTSKNDGAAANGTSPTPNMANAVISVKGSRTGASPEKEVEQRGLPLELVEVGDEFYRPLSKLYQRMAQECFNSLNETLRDMSNIIVQQQPNGVSTNGMGGQPNRNLDSSAAIEQKKILLLDFAYENRSKFIKLLVLTSWAEEKAIPIKKVIDMNAAMSHMIHGYDFVCEQFEIFRQSVRVLQEKNPDMRTALEILSKGKAEWIPDMGYIPAEPLPPEDGLKLLRTFNTTIAIRLNVHERLPRQMKKWKVANGRVTFTVDHEFEMDLFTLSEDETEPWQFIDLRFLFSPAPEIDAEGRFLMQFKAQADHMLRKSGLSGCFDFIHSFVLTHKISTLGTQAYQLSRGVWGGTLNVEPVHRSLIVQYWVERPGKKNWVEIGISTNKPKSGKISWRGPPISSLAARWFRDGKEVKGVDLKFDFNDLSMERILRRTISLHISSILKATQDAISPRLKIHPSLSETEPSECSLEVTLGRSNNKTILSVEQVSGRYVLQPSTWVSTQAERAINQFTATSPSTAITQLLTQTLHDSIKRCAELLGWRTLPRNTLRMDALKQATKLDVLHYVLLRPTGWTAKWILAAVIDASGESWWALELGGQGTVVEHAEHISMERTGPIPEISRDTLASIDRVAVQQLEYHVSMRELRKRGVQCSVCTDLAATESPDLSTDSASLISSTALRGWSLNVRTSDLLQSKTAEDQWLDPYIRVISQGFASDYRDVSHIASGTMVKSVAADMQKLMSASVQSNFAFSEDGKFAIHLTTPFGEPIADELKARLRDVDRLRSFATILQKRKMKLRKSSLQQVQFQYGETDTATVDFGREDDIKVTFPPKNPHNRIARFLTELINNRPPFNTPENSGLDRFCETLVLTRPILAALAELENATPGNLHDPAVFVHHVNYYRITYANPLCSFDIQLRQKDDKMLWHIDDNNKKDNELKPGPERNPNHKRIETLKTALSILFKKTGGPDQKWIGVRSGILAPLDGIPDALKALHETVTSCAVEGGYKMPTDIKAEEASTTPATKGSRVAVPAPAPVAPVPAPSPASTGISASTHAQNQATQQRRNFPNLGRKPQGKGPKQEVIELD